MEPLLEDGGLNVWKQWAKPLLDEDKIKPGSVNSYLSLLAKFCEFLVDHHQHKVTGFPILSEDTVSRATSVGTRFRWMCSSVGKEYAHTKWEKRIEDEANAIPVTVIQGMMDTEPAKQAIHYLIRSYNNLPTEKMFLAIRNFLVARLEIENCQHPGPLKTATLTEFQRSKEVDDKMVMSVARHKTSKAGPAAITMSINTYSNVKAYVQHVTPHFAKEDEQALFVTREGDAFETGTIGRRASAWWKRATGLDINSTQLRKVGSTESMKEDLQTQTAIQTVMTHKRATAEEHYQILNKTKQAVVGHMALAKRLGLQESVPTTVPDPKQQTDTRTSAVPASPDKTGLNKDQLADIDLLFAQQISTNAAITMTEVRNVMSESFNLVFAQS